MLSTLFTDLIEIFVLVGVILTLYEPFLKTRLENEGLRSGERFQHFSIKLYLEIYWSRLSIKYSKSKRMSGSLSQLFLLPKICQIF